MKSFELLVQESTSIKSEEIGSMERDLEEQIKKLIILMARKKHFNLDESEFMKELKQSINDTIKKIETEREIYKLLRETEEIENYFLTKNENKEIYDKIWK